MSNSITQLLAQALPFWSKLSTVDQKQLLSASSFVHYKEGEAIHNADDCIGLIMVKSGELRTFLLSDQGKDFTLFRLQEGDVCLLSAGCLFADISFTVFIQAEKDSEVLLINTSTFSQLQKQNLLIENFALRIMADKFSQVVRVMEKLLFFTLEERLATFLLEEYAKVSGSGIALTHEQIAQYISSAREVVSRSLKGMEREGLLKVSRGGITLLDIAGIEKKAGRRNNRL